MAQNFLYMFEFSVDDLLITEPSCCAPDEYPTCVEISFRSSVFVSICDREFGQCPDMCAAKCCKCCLFSLESPITDKDRLLVHVYKKKNDKCKYLEGAADFPVKSLFDKVTERFNMVNPNWVDTLNKFTSNVPDPKAPNKPIRTDCFFCYDADILGRPEQFCATSELTKRLLPLYNMNQVQTGNLMLMTRLNCNGPTIVSSCPFSKICKSACPPDESSCPGARKGCLKCQPSSCVCDTESAPQRIPAGGNGNCVQPDPCVRLTPKKPPCKRYFACNVEKGCPCSECEDYCNRRK